MPDNEEFMARPLRIQFSNACYHVTCRGNERRNIYRDDTDRELFLEKLRGSLGIYGVVIHAYVLMGNHFHLIVQTPKANLSEFMRHFNIAYTGTFNRRHRRVGHLYQGRYKAILVEKDSYLAELSRYVHLNPVRVKPYQNKTFSEQWKVLERYPWSSLSGYLSSTKRKPWIYYEEVLEQTGGRSQKYREFLDDGLRQGYETPWDRLHGQMVLAGEKFVTKLSKSLGKTPSKREQPASNALGKVPAKEVLETVSRHYRLKPEDIAKKRTRYRDERAMVMEVMHRFSRISQGEIGNYVGDLDYSAVSRERKRLREMADHNRDVAQSMERVERLFIQK
jgi:REP-associated tyrosine transposase